jgi:mutator protein MutT
VRQIHVVAALIERRGQVLLDRRPPGGRHAGLWEFPGGKREPGETDEQALERELFEELGVASTIGPEVARSRNLADVDITLVLYRAEIQGEPTAKEVDAVEWFDPWALASLPMPPADKPLLEAVLRLLS